MLLFLPIILPKRLLVRRFGLVMNSLFYVNQAYLTIEKRQKIFYGDYFFLGQVIQIANVPTNIESYVCGPDEGKKYRPLYDVNTRDFKGLHETIAIIIVRGDDSETSKLLYSVQKKMYNKFFFWDSI